MWSIEKLFVNKDVVEYLIEKGANVNEQDNDGKTVLMIAKDVYRAGELKVIIDKGADVNAQDNDGKTALMYAIEGKNQEYVKLLIHSNANIHIEDWPAGDTIKHYIEKDGDCGVEPGTDFADYHRTTQECYAFRIWVVDFMNDHFAKKRMGKQH